MDGEHFPTIEELRAKKAALKAAGGEAFAINTLINQRRPVEDLKTEISARKEAGKPTDRLEAEVWLRENGIFG